MSAYEAFAKTVGAEATSRNQGQLDKQLNKIINSPSPSVYKYQAAQIAKPKAKGSGGLWGGLGKFLDIVDTGRAGIVSAVNEAVDLTAETFKLPGHQYTSVSWDDWLKHTKDNFGAGDLIYEQSRASALGGDNDLFGMKLFSDDELAKLKADPDNYRPKFTKGGRAFGIAGGLVGDIAADPLTYLAPEAKLAKAGGAKSVGRLMLNAADDPEAWSIGQKIIRESGIKGLSKAELAKVNKVTELGLQGGVHMNVPGTGRFARNLAENVGLKAPELRQVRIAGQEVANLMPGTLAKKALGRGKQTVIARHIAEALGGDVGALANRVSQGTPEEARSAFLAMDNLQQRRFAAKKAGEQVEHEYVKLRVEGDKISKAAKVDVGTEIQRLLDMDDTARLGDAGYQAIEAAAPGYMSKVAAFNEYARTQLNDLGEKEFIQRFDYWRPSITTDDWKALLVDLGRSPGKGGGVAPAWFERAALRPGDEFLGELIEEPSKVGGKGIHEQMLGIVQDKSDQLGWRTVENMFEPDYFKAMEAYTKAGLHRATMVSVEGRLAKEGIAVDRFTQVFDKSSEQTLQKRRRAVREVWNARLAEKRKRAVMEQVNQDLSDAQLVESATAVGGAAAKADAKKGVRSAARASEAANDTLRYTALAAEGAEEQAARVSREGVRRAVETLDVFDEQAGAALRDAKVALDGSAAEVERIYGARNRLLEARDDALTKLTIAEERATARVEAARLPARLHDEVNKIEDTIAALDAKIAARGLSPDHVERAAKLSAQVKKNDTIARMVEDFLTKSKLPSTVTGLTNDDLAALARKVGTEWPVKDVAAQKRVRQELQAFLDQKAKPLVEHQKESLRQLQVVEKVHGQSLKAINGERTDLLRSLDGTRGQLDAAIVNAAGDPVAQRFVEMEQSLARVDGSGYLLNPNDDLQGHYWYHGVGRNEGKMNSLDMSLGLDEELRATAELDTYGVGPHFAQAYDYSLNFAGSERQSMGVTRLRVENPIVYGTGPRSMLTDGSGPIQPLLTDMIGKGENDIIYEALTGWKFSEGKRGFALDMIERGLKNDVTTPNEIAELAGIFDNPALARQVTDAFDQNYQRLIDMGMEPIEAIGASLRDTSFGRTALNERAHALTRHFGDDEFAAAWDELPIDHPLRAANPEITDLTEHFGSNTISRTELDQLKLDIVKASDELGSLDRHFYGGGELSDKLAVMRPDEEFIASRFLWDSYFESAQSRVRNTNMPSDHMVRLGKNFRESVQAEGHDGILYASTDDAMWNAVPLDSAQVERLRGQELHDAIGRIQAGEDMGDIERGVGDFHTPETMAKVVKDSRDVMGEVGGLLRREVDEQRQLVKTIGAQLDEPMVGAEDAQRAWFSNALELDTLARDVAAQREPFRNTLDNALQEEFAWRQHADDMYREAGTLFTAADEAELQKLNKLAALGQVAEDTDLASKQAAAYSLRMQAAAAKAEADWTKAGKKKLKADVALARLKRPESMTRIEALVIPNGMSKLGWDKMAPTYIVDALSNSGKMLNEPGWMRQPLRMYDGFMSTWKGYQLATPGFHFRNTFGGVFNNWLAGIDMGRYQQFRNLANPYYRELRKGGDELAARAALRKAAKDPQEAMWFEQVLDSGILTGGQSTDVIVRQGERASLNPFSTNNPVTRLSTVGQDIGKTGRHIPGGRDVENFLRGSLAMDTLAKGGDINAAIDNVVKYHFDYDDLSRFERSVMRRVFPFYTWTRKNLPLQIEGMLENPKAYTRMMTVQRNVGVGIDTEEIVPSWFGDTITMDTGVEDPDGSRLYWMPDLPYKDIRNVTSARNLLSQTGPLVKTPLELWAGKKFFQDIPFKDGYYRAPSTWEKLGIPQILSAMPMGAMAHKGSDGGWYMSEKDSYLVEQMVPLLGRVRRVLPSAEQQAGKDGESKFQQRQLAFLLSMNFGLGLRANTPQDKEIELWRRTKELEKQSKLLTDLGYIERQGQ